MSKKSQVLWGAIARLCKASDAKIFGSRRPNITTLASASSGSEGALSFIASNRHDRQSLADRCNSSVIICDPAVEKAAMLGRRATIIVTEKPRELFLEICGAIFPKPSINSIHESAVIYRGSTIGLNVALGAHSVIDGAVVGDGTEIGAHCYIGSSVVIGRGVRIKAGSVIGGDGFGYVRTAGDRIVNMPHIGRVIIEDNVHVGSNSTIDRGSLVDTVIGPDSKLDNLVHISHNVRIGARCLLAAHVVICGSARLEDDCYCGPSSVVEYGLSVGIGAVVGSGSCVKRNVPNGEVWLGNPAIKLEAFYRRDAAIRRLLPVSHSKGA